MAKRTPLDYIYIYTYTLYIHSCIYNSCSYVLSCYVSQVKRPASKTPLRKNKVDQKDATLLQGISFDANGPPMTEQLRALLHGDTDTNYIHNMYWTKSWGSWL